ncbi:hypothetical protein FOZ62_014835, partial [Perkinsus olseni]
MSEASSVNRPTSINPTIRKEVERRLVRASLVLGWSENSITSDILAWALSPVIPDYEKCPITRHRVRQLKQEAFREEMDRAKTVIASEVRARKGASVSILIDGWTPPYSSVPMLVAAVSYISKTGSRITVPWFGRGMRPKERETSSQLSQFLLTEVLRDLDAGNLGVGAIVSDNAKNVEGARRIAAKHINDRARTAHPPGSAGHIRPRCLEVGCLAHQNALLTRDLAAVFYTVEGN